MCLEINHRMIQMKKFQFYQVLTCVPNRLKIVGFSSAIFEKFEIFVYDYSVPVAFYKIFSPLKCKVFLSFSSHRQATVANLIVIRR